MAAEVRVCQPMSPLLPPGPGRHQVYFPFVGVGIAVLEFGFGGFSSDV